MSESVETAPLPPLPYRARPPQVLLGVGAVLLVSAAAAVASVHGGLAVRVVLVALAGVATWFALRAGRARLPSSEEVLAACAASLAVAGISQGGLAPHGDPVSVLVLAACFFALHRLAPTTAAWPLASWGALQLAVLRGIHLVPVGLHTEVQLCVALLGLGIALSARQGVARIALVTTAPWWLAGVVGGSASAWADDGGRQWLSAVLMIAAGFGLMAARSRDSLGPLLGPPALTRVVAGVVAGAAVTGAFSSLGPLAMTLTGYAGVLLANTAAAVLEGKRRTQYLPVALAAGIVMAALCVVQLVALQRWSQLSLLLLLTAVPTVVVAVRRPEERHVAVPVAVWCLAGATLLALPDDRIGPVAAAVVLTVVYAAAMTAGSALGDASRTATARAAALCAVAPVLLLRASGHPALLAAVLAIQGACTLTWAWRSRPRTTATDGVVTTAWRAGAAQLVVAAWIAAATADLHAIEWYTLPAAGALLLAAGPRLGEGSSWSAWGPGLLVAAVPSGVLAVVTSDGARAGAVLVAAAAVMVAGARAGIRAPLVVGAGTALALALGFTVRALPWPLGTALVVGAALLTLGARRERNPVDGFGRRLADLR